MPRSLRIAPRKKEEWAKRIADDLASWVESRSDWMEDYARGMRTIRMIPDGEKDQPWPNCSNIVTPITHMQYEQSVRRLTMYMVGNREYVTLVPNSKAVEISEAAEAAEGLLRWQAENPMDYWNYVDDFVRDFCGSGTAIGMGGWIRVRQMVAEALVLGRDRLVETSPGSGSPKWVPMGERATRKWKFEDIAKEVFSQQNVQIGESHVIKGTPKDLEIRQVLYRESGKPWQKARITIDRDEALGDEIEVVCERYRIVHNEPFLKAIRPDRVLVPPGDDNIQTAEAVCVKSWVSWEYVQKQMGEFGHRKTWDLTTDQMREIQDVMVDMTDAAFTQTYHAAAQENGEYYDELMVQDETDEYVGVDSTVSRVRKVPMFEITRRWPILKDSDEPCEARMIFLPTFGMIPWVHHEGAVGLADQRSFVSHQFEKNRGQFYGTSLARSMESVQELADAFSNMEADTASITTAPVLFAGLTTILPRDNQAYYPGAVIRSGDKPEVANWPSRVGEFEAIQSRLAAWAQMVGRQSETSVGLDPNHPQQNRTARGAMINLSERGFNVAYDGESLVRPITRGFKIVHAYDAMYLPEGFEYRILGTDEVRTTGRSKIRGDFDFRFEVGQATQNDEMRRQNFREFAQIIAPFAMAMPEQVPRPAHNLMEDMGKRFGIRNVSRYMPEIVDGIGESIAPEIEHQFFLHGRPVVVHPNDVDSHHIEAHMAWVQTPEFEAMDRRMVPWFKKHVLEHMKRMESGRSAAQTAAGRTGVQMAGPLAMGAGRNPAVPAGPGQPPVGEPVRGNNGAPLSSIGVMGP